MCVNIDIAANACSFMVTLMCVFTVIFKLPCWNGCLRLRVPFLLLAQHNAYCCTITPYIPQQLLLGREGGGGGGDTSKSTGRSGRQKAATRRNMRREEWVTVQGPVKKQQPDGMSHRGAVGWDPPPLLFTALVPHRG